MKCVVTGSEGFLGRKVVSRLSATGCPIIAVDRVEHASDSPPGVISHLADLADPPSLLPASEEPTQPFTLIHLAWDMRRFDGFAIQAAQVRQFAEMLDYWGSRGVRKVIAMGSAEEYGNRSGRLCESDAPVFPLSPYGWAKRAARDLAHSWSNRSGIPVIWLRPFIIYGPGQRSDMLIPSALEAARQQRNTKFTDGRQRRDFVFIDDVVEAIALSVKKHLSGFHEFNLGRGEGVPVAEVLMTIAKHYHAEDKFELGARARRPGEPENQIADATKAKEVLGWEAAIGCAEGLGRLFS